MIHSNRLIHEKSPYLLQHAHNPIDWYPWSEEAFSKAKEENKPIFLSIGYSTCHWCHVMARESFEDEEVAAYMNEHYVAIKVDREERPDIDSIYMRICQMMTGAGGWPLTIIMTPEKIPFFSGTYFPRISQQGHPGILDVLTTLQHNYHYKKEKLADIEEGVQQALHQIVQIKSKERLSKETVEEAFTELSNYYDPVFGGFGTGQKFPQPQNLLFLLHYYQTTKNPQALQMVEHTLSQMLKGGIWDQVGYGFSRYTIDRRWQTPHFEKMLYDNALLLMVFTTCYQITKNPLYEEISHKIITFIDREMTSPESAFYSAIDADSEGEEGTYYVWDYAEIYDVLDRDQRDVFAEAHQISQRGNFEGKNIIQGIKADLQTIAQDYHISEQDLKNRLEEARETLYQIRLKRTHPHTDDKILTSWNSLMIASLARASRAFPENGYLEKTEKALSFIEGKLFQEGRVMARYRDGETKHLGYLDDYAFLNWAYIEMYQASYDLLYLQKAIHLTTEMDRLFWDSKEGGFFFSGRDGEKMIASDKEIAEGAMPSGNSIAGFVYAKLQKLTGESTYGDRLFEMYHLFHNDVNRAPSSAPSFLQSLLLMEYPGKEVITIGMKNDPYRESFLNRVKETYLPNIVVLVAEDSQEFKGIADFATKYPKKRDETTIYICENFTCQQPTTKISEALEVILKEERV